MRMNEFAGSMAAQLYYLFLDHTTILQVLKHIGCFRQCGYPGCSTHAEQTAQITLQPYKFVR